MRSLGILACGVLLFSFGCGSDNPVAPPPNPHPYDGNWSGTTSEGRRVHIAIAGSRIVSFETFLNMGERCSAVLQEVPSAPIVNREFSFTVPPFGLGRAPTVVSGRMEGETSMRGNIGAFGPLTSAFCGAEVGFVKEALTFTADQ